MSTKTSAELTLFDKLSRLTFLQAVKHLGPEGKRLIHEEGAYEIDIEEQLELKHNAFRLRLSGSTVTLSLDPGTRGRLKWQCDTCKVPARTWARPSRWSSKRSFDWVLPRRRPSESPSQA